MKLDRERMKLYAKLPDSILWAQIVALGEKNGLKLPSKAPDRDTMARLRRFMTGEESIGLAEALTLINDYKRKGGMGT